MAKKVDVVTVNVPTRGKMMRIAPCYSHLKPNDDVMIEVDYNPFEIRGRVEDVATWEEDSDAFRQLRLFVGMNEYGSHELDLKVTKRLYYSDIWDGVEDDG